jgi:hypothetical protein
MNHTIIATVAASIALAVAWTIGAIDHVPIQAYAVSSTRIGQTGDQTQQLQGSVPIILTGPSGNTETSNSDLGANNNTGANSDPGQQGAMGPQPPANPTIDPEAQGPIGQMMNGLMGNALDNALSNDK